MDPYINTAAGEWDLSGEGFGQEIKMELLDLKTGLV